MSKGFGEQLGFRESVKICFGKALDLSKTWNWVRIDLDPDRHFEGKDRCVAIGPW
jgi:hypothetical protein